MARKAKQVKRKLALHRKGRPRWGAGFQQRIVPAARGGPSRRASTRELLEAG